MPISSVQCGAIVQCTELIKMKVLVMFQCCSLCEAGSQVMLFSSGGGPVIFFSFMSLHEFGI